LWKIVAQSHEFCLDIQAKKKKNDSHRGAKNGDPIFSTAATQFYVRIAALEDVVTNYLIVFLTKINTSDKMASFPRRKFQKIPNNRHAIILIL
jgi:hypothetical protein